MGARGALRVAALVLLLLIVLPSWGVARLFGREGYWVRFFLRWAARIFGMRLDVVGAPVRGPALLAANHLSWLDIVALGAVTNARFIAKAQIKDWPLIGWLARMAGSVFVSRERRSETRIQTDAVSRALGGPRPVMLFAEGGTGNGIALAPFRPALFAAAMEAGVPVQPVAVNYGARRAEIAWPDDTGFAVEMKRILRRGGPIPVTLHFAAPLDPRVLDRKALAERAHDAVAAALGASASACTPGLPA